MSYQSNRDSATVAGQENASTRGPFSLAKRGEIVLERDGMYVIGEFAGVEQVNYGPKDPVKEGRPVPGMFRVSVSQAGFSFPRSVVFFRTDQETGEVSRAFRELMDPPLQTPCRIAVRVSASGEGKYVNLRALAVEVIPSLEPEFVGASSNGGPVGIMGTGRESA